MRGAKQSVSPENKTWYDDKVKYWQKRNRDFVKENSDVLRRHPEREGLRGITFPAPKDSDLQQAFKPNSSYIRSDGSFDLEAAKSDYAKFVDAAPERIKPALEYAFNTTPFVETQNKNIVFAYSSKQESILYNPKGDNFNDYRFVISASHELGHRVDDMFKFSKGNETFSAAVAAAAQTIEKERNRFVSYSWESDEDGFISDIFSAIDMSDMYYASHDIEYWRRPGIREAEIYANLFGLEAVNDVKKLQYLRKYFPEIMQEYDKMNFEV